jgi:hypothetical protein
MSDRPQNPREAWQAMIDGNKRFVSGDLAHPRQDIDHREKLAEKQTPFAAPIQDCLLKLFLTLALATFLSSEMLVRSLLKQFWGRLNMLSRFSEFL